MEDQTPDSTKSTATSTHYTSYLRHIPMNLPMADQDLWNDRQKGIQLRWPSLRLTIPRRLRMLQHFRQSLPVNPLLAAHQPLAQFAGQNAATNFTPKFHVGNHPDALELLQNDAVPGTIQT